MKMQLGERKGSINIVLYFVFIFLEDLHRFRRNSVSKEHSNRKDIDKENLPMNLL